MAACTVEFSGPAGATLSVVACGDSAALVTVSGVGMQARWECVRLLAERLGPGALAGMLGTVATYDTVLVEYDALILTFADVGDAIRTEANSTPSPADADHGPAKKVVIPVVYGGAFGPDLEELAGELEMSPDALVQRHGAAPYVIRTVASPAGAPMTDGPDLPRPPRRLAVPRAAVPGGSVAVAGRQGIVYATPSPGGWRLIGRTPLILFDPHVDPPVPYRAGDQVQYVPIKPDQWSDYAGTRAEVRDA